MYQRFYTQHVKRSTIIGKEVNGLCPFHEDKKPSFFANIDTGQWYCFGCNRRGNAFTFAKSLHIPIQTVPQNNSNHSHKKPVRKNIIAEYNYYDEKSELLYQIIRYEPKDFKIRRPDGSNGWIWNLKGVRLIPYCLPDVLQSQEVLICEGEKDVNLLRKEGFCATCNPLGAGKWKRDYNRYFEGKDVVVLPDNDEPGKDHANQVVRNLLNITKSVKLVSLPVGEKQDVSDYLNNHHAQELRELIQATGFYQTSNNYSKLNYQVIQLSTVSSTGDQFLWKPYLPIGNLTLIEGVSTVHKFWFLQAIAASCSSGNGLPGIKCFHPYKVLFLHPEKDRLFTMKSRLDSMGADCDNIFFIQDVFPFNDSGLSDLMNIISNYNFKLVIIDPFDTFLATRENNGSNNLGNILSMLSKISEHHRCAICVVRHLIDEKRSKPVYYRLCSSVLLVREDPKNSLSRMMIHVHSKLVKPGKPVSFKIENGQFLWI